MPIILFKKCEPPHMENSILTKKFVILLSLPSIHRNRIF